MYRFVLFVLYMVCTASQVQYKVAVKYVDHNGVQWEPYGSLVTPSGPFLENCI